MFLKLVEMKKIYEYYLGSKYLLVGMVRGESNGI